MRTILSISCMLCLVTLLFAARPARAEVAPYGAWKSPITAEMVVGEAVRLGQIVIDGTTIYWDERHPQEAGRSVIMRYADGEISPVTPPFTDSDTPYFNVRTRVHEYGGGAFTVADGVVYFSNFKDQKLYRQAPGEEPEPLTTVEDMFYADGVIDSGRERMYCVREDHSGEGEAVNTIVSLNLADGSAQVIVSGNDFYSSPRLNHDDSKLAWTTWNHPNMPWDETELWVADIQADGSVSNATKVAGETNESIVQPRWSPDGTLYFISDRSGWWNLYAWDGEEVKALSPMEAEFSGPRWVFGISSYTLVSAEELICTYFKEGSWRLARINTQTGEMQEIETPYTEIGNLKSMNGTVVFTGASPTTPAEIVKLDLATTGFEVLHQSAEVTVAEGYLSIPEQIKFPTENDLSAYGIFYAPKNQDYNAPEGTKPPLLVFTHGGPTGATSTAFDINLQYWTSRGFAILDVNYGGSTGYGRAYRDRLKGQWGLVDVDDAVNGAQYLVQEGYVDGDKLAIRGGSAGGYTTLSALVFRDVFDAGASYYGISELEVLAQFTHKFESRYLDSLIGPYEPPIGPGDPYYDRSPINFTDGISAPLILFQGDEDPIVPPEQSRMMVKALAEKGLPHAYIEFPGESHGFRKAENIIRSLEAEYYFYAKIFGFEPADEIEPVDIQNFD